MADPQKDTIYIDVDDEITSIIDKLRSSKQKIVALVLPKRATVFHSIVNMKLLKRAADESKKNLVLITSETGIIPLAGVVGLYVAKTPQSKPVIPPAPNTNEITESVSEDNVDDVELDKTAAVGALAGLPGDDADETIEVDNADKSVTPAVTGKKALNKKLRIPNFEKFRLRLFLGVLAIIFLIVGWVYAAMILPKAKITIKTDTQSVTSNITLTTSPKAKDLQKVGNIVPAEVKEYKKTDATKVSTTGKKDNGIKATGTMTLTNCINDSQPHTVPAGTGFSSGSFTFITTADVTLSTSVYSGTTCRTDLATSLGFRKDVPVVASQAGDQYNLSARSYTSPASLSTSSGSITAAGSNMSGGTSKITKVVAQSDVDGAKQKVLDQNLQPATAELINKLNTDGFTPIVDTFSNGNPVVTTTPNIGDEADEVNVSLTITYTMLGAKQSALKQLVEDDVNQHIDATKQTILDNGLAKAVFTILDKPPNGDVKVSMQTVALAGVQQDVNAIKKAVAGKKKGDTQTVITQRPGVKDVTINYSPFWVSSTPSKLSKITVIFEQSSSNASNP